MQDFTFATVLFVAYFSFLCCFLRGSSSASIPLPVEQEPEKITDSAVIDDLWDEQRVSVAIALSDEFDLQPEGENYTPDTRVQEQTLEELVEGIDLDTLQLRPARKICGKLGIQQKVNSKDAPLSWLRTQIKARLIEKPIEVAPLIQEVLKAS